MAVAIVFAVVFVPFFVFVFLVWRAGKKMPESALAHLERKVYKVKSHKDLKGIVLGWLFVGLPMITMISIGGLIVFDKSDPVYIVPGVKESLVVIYLLVLILPFYILGIAGGHNLRMMKDIVLDLDPSEGVIGWKSEKNSYTLRREDFERINTLDRKGKSIETVHELILKNGQKLYLTLAHPGYHALMAMLKDVPQTAKEYYLPIVPVDVPPLLRIAKRVVDTAIRYYIVEMAVIAFLSLSIFAMHYYEKNQKNLDQLLPARELKVVGSYTRIGMKGKKYYYLWIHDGRFPQEVRVNRKIYQEGVSKGSALLYYNANNNRYDYKVTDFGLYHFLSGALGILAIFLAGRIVWLVQKRRKQALP